MTALTVFIFHFIISPDYAAEPVEDLANHLANAVKDQNNKRVAVLGFSYADNKQDDFSILVQERLTTFLVSANKVEVIERSLLKKLLEEKNLELTGLIDSQSSSEIGKILGVGAIISGTLNSLSKTKVELNARIIDTQTGKILAAKTLILDREKLNETVIPKEMEKKVEYLGQPLVQIAILLDTSSSMDGLIDQAKAQLWKVVNDLARAEQKGKNPTVQVAIYEYGNDSIPQGEKYVRQVLPFTSDLDKISEKLFALKTNGGEEYCGAVIQDAINNLQWKEYADVYKVIFIAGNEPFTQGPVDFRDSISAAVKKGIVVNTIFCGDLQQGIATQWKAGAIAGNGEYLAIDHQKQAVIYQAPQDQEIQNLGQKLNDTYIPYGERGVKAYERQSVQDKNAASIPGAGAATERSVFKAQKQYSRAEWDVVSSVESGKMKLKDIKRENLPDGLKKLSQKELEIYINNKIKERQALQAKINKLNKDRLKFISEKEKQAPASQYRSLDRVMKKAIREQAAKHSYEFQE